MKNEFPFININLKRDKKKTVMANTLSLKIDGINITVEQGSSILDAARKHNIHIPTLCYHEDLGLSGSCSVCVVEQKGKKSLVPACSTFASEGMEIYTNTHKVRNTRRNRFELLLSEHDTDDPLCYKISVLNYRHLLMKV
ncbi:MAG TPA: hypothetical protein DCG75_06220 [Bacteroidales bacterium]|nr:hypothetical protein [Bacteroidales bacterium]